MPQLDIGGTKIQIDDGFLKLSPQAQNDFVKNTIIPSPEFQAAQKAGTAPPAPEKAPDWADVPLEAVKHFLPNAGDVAMHVGGAALQTAENYLPYGPLAVPKAIIDAGKSIYNDPTKIPRAVWNDLVDKYGGEENLRRSLAYRPAEVALDIASVVAPIEGAVGKVGEISRAADVSKPFYEGLPREAPPTVPQAAPPPLPAEGGLGAVREAVESQPRALTTDNRFLQQSGQVLSKVPLVGDPLGKAIEAVPGKFGEARNVVADELGDYRTPQNVAKDIGEDISGKAEAETKARTAAAEQTDAAAQAAYERANQEREQAIAQREQQSTQAAQQQIGNVAPVGMGDAIIDTIRNNHERLTAEKDRAYEAAANVPGAITAEGVQPLYRQAEAAFANSGRSLSDLTPAANNTRAALRNLSDLIIPDNMRGPHVPGGDANSISVQGLNLFRKQITSLARQATTPEDAAAARVYTRAFDDWQERATRTHMASGDPEAALQLLQDANARNRDLMERFGYNDRNDADATLNKIVQHGDQIGSEDISRALFAGGSKPQRLLNAFYQATGDHPNHGNVVQAIRGGFWNKLATGVEGGKTRTPEAIAGGINEFMARPLAHDIFTPQDQALARAHAATLRGAETARTEAAALARANRPVPTEVTKGPMQELADRVIGSGQKPGEALYKTIEGYAKAKGGGRDIETLGRLWANLPEDLKGSFTNTFIRGLGKGAKGDFSPAVFAKEWKRNVNPQAKQVLFGDGAHVRALDELADASETFDKVHARFGNPSGSGQAINYMKVAGMASMIAGGTFVAPLTTLGSWFAGRQFAHLLATPQGAASASRFVRQVQRLQSAPTLANAAATKLTVRNMRNTATALGIAHNIPDHK